MDDCNNSGIFNSGYYNSGNFNAGFFCTETPKPTFFDKPCDLPWVEVYKRVPYLPLDLQGKTYHEAFREAWANANDATRQRFLDLPNFDAEKFLAITGVDVREKTADVVGIAYSLDGVADLPDHVTVNGVRYVREVKP